MNGIQILPPLNYIGNSEPEYQSGSQEFFSGIGKGLQKLAQQRTTELVKQKELKSLEKIGFSPQESEILTYIKEINPQQYSEYLGRALENIGSRQSQQYQGQPQEVVNEQIQSPSGKEISVQEEVTKPTISKNIFEKKLSPQDLLKKELAVESHTKDIRHEAVSQKRKAKANISDFIEARELNTAGNLNGPGYESFLERSGLGSVKALRNPDSEQFKAIMANQFKDIGESFKGSISKTEIGIFNDKLPTLLNSPEGRKRIIEAKILEERSKVAWADAIQEAIKQSGGKPTFDLEERAYEIADKKIDRLAAEYRKLIKAPVPEAESKWRTYSGVIGGSTIGGVADVAKTIGSLGGAVKGLGSLV